MNSLKKAVILMIILTLIANFYTFMVLTITTTKITEIPMGNAFSSDSEVFVFPALECESISITPLLLTWVVIGFGWIGLGIVIIRQKRERRFQNE